MSEIADRVKAIIVDKLGVDEGQVTEAAAFTTDIVIINIHFFVPFINC